ncbi:MAG: type II 3-dehydroquinate dehydratase [Bacteroidales bacterium]|nr:type II 3-dehydroquinate dehydratase [Bacteroidales bacterium]
MRIAIINGPNLNTLGKREPALYGDTPFEPFLIGLQQQYPQHLITCFQSNDEGAIVTALQQAGDKCDAVILNAGAYTHTSLAIADAVRSLGIPVIEVHLTNIFAREQFRHHSYLTPVCKGLIAGLGLDGYRLAVAHLTAKP